MEQNAYFTPQSHMAAICAYYQSHFSRSDGTIPASFEFVTMTGWKPHHTQQQPAERGSGQISFKEI
jgi:NADH dehydrogenase [ubiquinone] 1 alpha subcomplex assembly factor 5